MNINKPCPYCGINDTKVISTPEGLTMSTCHKKNCESLPIVFPYIENIYYVKRTDYCTMDYSFYLFFNMIRNKVIVF